ncbi:hypothetical protein RSAG8_07324, partial [Rhizoctonia solani AG-8 WAC10335]
MDVNLNDHLPSLLKKKGPHKIKYFVKWKGYGIGKQTWEPSELHHHFWYHLRSSL